VQESTPESTQESTTKGWDQGTWLALVLGIGLVVLWGPLLGFYFATVLCHNYSTNNGIDLQRPDMINGFKGAAVGAGIGLIGLIVILKMYPSRTKKDLEDWKEEFSHPHFDKLH
jgi:hypothetical protein